MNLIHIIKKTLGIDDRKATPTQTVVVKKPGTPTSLEYPRATQSRKVHTQGKYPLGYPEGAVIHYTAGSNDPKSVIEGLRRNAYVTFVIDRMGFIWQDFSLDEWGYHAGKSSWKDIQGTVHNRLVGIELISAGKVDKMGDEYRTWFGTILPSTEVRYIPEGPLKGYYHTYSTFQEDALTNLLLWLHKNGNGIFSFDYVAGHHEVSPGRKTDPGGSLSMSMEDYREYLKKNSLS